MYITVKQLANKINNLDRFTLDELKQENKTAFTDEEIKKAQQWIADIYHCSEIWGTKQSDEEMLIELQESQKQKDDNDYSPDPGLYKECAAYWNMLAEVYPN